MRINVRFLIKGIRPQQWVKNSFVFIALLFSVSFMDIFAVVRVTIAFFCLCVLSSGGYLLNDIIDAESDRRHPHKRLRPVAIGALGVGEAGITAIVLIIGAMLVGFYLNILFGCILLAYFLINLIYSFWLKKIVIIDVFTIAAFFFMRVFAGAVVINVEISSWLLFVTLFLALFLALIKRRAELILVGANASASRLVLAEYGLNYLDQMIMISATATIVSYALYTFSSIHSDKLMITLPFVVYGIFRYLYLVYNKRMGENPEESFLRDWPFVLNLILYTVAVIAILSYFG
jgi:4-hydroxybenzoate polyprenyltransferase